LRLEPHLTAKVEPGHWFAQAWALAVGEVAEALDLGGGAGPLEVRAAQAEPERWAGWRQGLWQVSSWTPGEDARLWLGFDAAVARALWRHIGGGDESGAADQALETVREMLNQAASSVSAEATSRLGLAVQAKPLAAAAPPQAGWAVELRFRTAGQDCAIALAGNAAMAAALASADVQGEETAPAPHQEPPADPLDLIREVSLELAVSFGDTSMPLADILKLSSGAIIELNRSVSDPVEVLVNDSVIARGDVVVVDGNYGVRITEIVSRRDRVRSLM
jgi:flagellar motor switch protein FliN